MVNTKNMMIMNIYFESLGIFQLRNIRDSQPVNENRISWGETVSDPAVYSSVPNTSSEKVCLESFQRRGDERIHMKMPPKALYLSAAWSKTSRRNFACKSTKELVMAFHGYLDVRPGSEVLMQQEPLQPTKLWHLHYNSMTSTAPSHTSQ